MTKNGEKENKNLYFQKREELGLTREQASELTAALSPDRIEKIENGRSPAHPDEVMVMAKAYRAPELCNYFCSHDCPIGKKYVPEIRSKDLSQIILETIASLNTMNKKQERFIEIGADGKISEEETEDFLSIQKELEKISVSVETLQLWYEQTLCESGIGNKKR